MKYSGIGGQAVMEGIMMKNADEYAVAVRTAGGEIEIRKETYQAFSSKHAFAKLPFIRGVFSFVDSLVLGIRTLMWSASQTEDENGEKIEFSGGEMTWTMIIAILVAIGIFVVLPTVLSSLLKKWIANEVLLAFVEGVLRLGLFIAYVGLVSLSKDIKRTYMYHGAEHKCINCVEHGLPLTVDNVMKSSKEHRRCGTSFLLIVMLISIVLFIIVRVDILPLKLLLRLLMIPVIAGISFEILRLTGRVDNKFTYIISRPGMWMQALTTKEPTPEMCEVAIRATEEVFDWRQFLRENDAEGEWSESPAPASENAPEG